MTLATLAPTAQAVVLATWIAVCLFALLAYLLRPVEPSRDFTEEEEEAIREACR